MAYKTINDGFPWRKIKNGKNSKMANIQRIDPLLMATYIFKSFEKLEECPPLDERQTSISNQTSSLIRIN